MFEKVRAGRRETSCPGVGEERNENAIKTRLQVTLGKGIKIHELWISIWNG